MNEMAAETYDQKLVQNHCTIMSGPESKSTSTDHGGRDSHGPATVEEARQGVEDGPHHDRYQDFDSDSLRLWLLTDSRLPEDELVMILASFPGTFEHLAFHRMVKSAAPHVTLAFRQQVGSSSLGSLIGSEGTSPVTAVLAEGKVHVTVTHENFNFAALPDKLLVSIFGQAGPKALQMVIPCVSWHRPSLFLHSHGTVAVG